MANVIKRKGRRCWYVVYWQDGRQVWRSTGSEDREYAESVAREVEALKEGRQRRGAAAAILEDAGDVPEVERRVELARLWEVYLEYEVRMMSRRTAESKRKAVRRWVKWMNNRYPEVRFAGEVTGRMAWEYMNDRYAEAAGVTWNNNLSGLRSVFATVRGPSGLRENVWEGIRRRSVDSVRRRVLSAAQVMRLVARARLMDGEGVFREGGFWPVAIMVGWHTGLRHGDVLTLEGGELDVEHDCFVLVPSKRRRAGLEITPWFHEDFRDELLAARVRGTGFLWPVMAEGLRRGGRWVYDEWRMICEAEGLRTSRLSGKGKGGRVPEFTFHSLRHGYVTAAANAGVNVQDIQVAVGHGSPVMTERYNHSRAVWERVKGKVPALKKEE